MNPVSRGIRNAFRNSVRTTSIVIILGLSIGLSLTMLVAQKAVEHKIQSVKSGIGTTINIEPAGFTPGADANNGLSSTTLNQVAHLPHVTSLVKTFDDTLPTTGASYLQFKPIGNGNTTSLTSPIVLNRPGNGDGPHIIVNGSSNVPTNFELPIRFLGTDKASSVHGESITITKGHTIDAGKDTNNALISQQMADKNNLSVGSTFSAYNATLTVVGIFTAENDGPRNTVVLPLAALQRLSGQTGAINNAVATVDSLDNLSSVTTAVKNKLGSSADVTSAEDQANNAVEPLNAVKRITTFSLIGAVAAGAVIILLTMIMIVRERKREIGVVKAIGGSNARIMGEFVVESLTLTILGAAIGLLIGVIGGQPVTKTLIDNQNQTSAAETDGPKFARAGMGGPVGEKIGGGPRPDGGFRSFHRNAAVQSFSDVKAQIGWSILLDGFGAAVFIAVLGSTLAAGMIAKVRPSTIMRAE